MFFFVVKLSKLDKLLPTIILLSYIQILLITGCLSLRPQGDETFPTIYLIVVDIGMFLTYVKACLTAAYETQIFYFLFNFSLFVGSKSNCTTKSTLSLKRLKGSFLEESARIFRDAALQFFDMLLYQLLPYIGIF